jgi:putative aldouronate transport system substrate-binding protein
MKKMLLVLVILSMIMTLAFAGGGRQSASSTAISVEVFDRGTDGGRSLAYDNAWTNWIKTKVKADLNLDVTFVPVGRWSETTDIVNLMASGAPPDLCYTYAGDMISNFRDQGGVLNLAPFVNQYLGDLRKLLGADPAFPGNDFIMRNEIKSGSMTGHIYSIPSYRVALAVRNFFIRQDWLSRLGIATPTNINQFHDALVAFRDRDPGAVGANRIVPYGQDSGARWGLLDLIRHHVPAMSDRDRWVNSVHERYPAFPGYKDGVRTMNTWYNERLIYQDFPLMTVADDFYNQLKSGVVGAFSANWDLPYRTDYNINLELARNVPGAEFVAIDLNLNNKEMMDKVGLQIFIPAASKNPTGALQYLNWLAKYDNYHYLQVGQEGVNHTLINGVPNIFTMPAGHPWIQNSSQNIDLTMPMNGVEMGSPELNSRVLALSYGNIPPQTIVNAYAASTANARAPTPRQVATTVNQYSQTLQDKHDALLSQAVTARSADFDRIWDTGYADWLASGGQEVLNERGRLWPAGQP